MEGAAKALAPIPGGVRILVRAAPRASRSGLVGVVDDGRGAFALKVAVAAPPVDGAANAAIVEVLASVLGVPKRSVRVARGASGRSKQVEVDGIDVAHALARITGAR